MPSGSLVSTARATVLAWYALAFSSCAGFESIWMAAMPDCAAVRAMPEPMVPAPMTAMVLTGVDMGRGS